MSVTLHARTRSASVNYFDLTPAQRTEVTATLNTLGYDGGYAADQPGDPDITRRAAASTRTAQLIGLRLPAGDELAYCADCDDIAPANDTRQCDDGATRCTLDQPDGTTCLGRWEQQQ